MLQSLLIHHLKKKFHLSYLILAWVLQIFLIIFLTYINSTFLYFIPLFINSIRLWQNYRRWCNFWCGFSIWRRNFICLTWCWLEFCRFFLLPFLHTSPEPFLILFLSLLTAIESLSPPTDEVGYFLRIGVGEIPQYLTFLKCTLYQFWCSRSLYLSYYNCIEMFWKKYWP